MELLHGNARLLKAINAQLARKRVKKIPPLRLPRPGEKKKRKGKPAKRLFDVIGAMKEGDPNG